MNRFKPGDIVEITETSKSKYKGAVATVVEYCNGWRSDILRIKIWRNKVVQICESSLSRPAFLQRLEKTNSDLVDAFLKKEDMMQEMHTKNQQLSDRLVSARIDSYREFQKKAKEKFVAIDGTFECSEVEELIDETTSELEEAVYDE